MAVEAVRRADAAVVVLGLAPSLEGAEMPVEVEGFRGGDRTSLDLPRAQGELLRAVHATGTPTVLVLLKGRAVAVNRAAEHVPAIVEAWYPGEEGGAHLPLLRGRRALPLRPRPELHDISILEPAGFARARRPARGRRSA